MIGKVTRGTNARRLLNYLYGPGKANEHTDPHLVAGFGDPAELEPERRPGGSRDLRRLAGLFAQPMAALNGDNYAKAVWHCSIRAAPEDRVLSDAEWAQVAAAVMDRTGLAPSGDDRAVRWVAVRHAPDHIHLVATLARQDRIRPKGGMAFSACGKPASRRSGSSGCARPPRRIAPQPGARRGPSRSRRPGVGGRSRRG